MNTDLPTILSSLFSASKKENSPSLKKHATHGKKSFSRHSQNISQKKSSAFSPMAKKYFNKFKMNKNFNRLTTIVTPPAEILQIIEAKQFRNVTLRGIFSFIQK